MIKLKRTIRFGVCFLFFWVALLFFALNSVGVAAASIAQGYHSDQSLALGTVVSATKTGSNQIQATTLQNEQLVVGVAVDSHDAIIDLQPHGSDVRIAISGDTSILVSNLSGDIKTGDSLVISPISGVAMKDASSSQATKYVAIANANFNAHSSGAHTVSIVLADGSKQKIAVGVISGKLLLTDRTPPSKNKSQNVLMVVGQRLAGRPVSTSQVLAASAVVVGTFILTGILVQGAVHGAFISLGRNPLSKHLILRNLFKVLSVGMLILGAGLAMSYAILLT